jgi:predicted CxxxxCH...CXXCH cytochrome family protein
VEPADMTAHQATIAAIAAGTAPRVTFGTLAKHRAASAAWSPVTAKCSNTYCHGSTLNHGGSLQEPTWTIVDDGHGQAACGTCHGFPPVNPGHPVLSLSLPLASDPCVGCHPSTLTGAIDATGFPTINVAGGKHVDGEVNVNAGSCTGGGCTCCHGAPPATGAHTAHVATEPTAYGEASLTPATATTYDFGCGNCHSLDVANHTSGMVDLSPVGAPAGSLKERNAATAAYDSIAGTCSGVYCHSTGQATPTFVKSPAWTGGATLGCAGCHANPPRYANGGAGSATANGHLSLWADGTWEWGHYAGLPGVSHENSKHGGPAPYWPGESAAPITCQTCHFDTTDPSNTGPSGFYYLDTTGNYELSDAGAVYTYSCASCHDGTAAPLGAGKVVPFFHVNGARDVAFDRRADLSTVAATYTLPAAPNRPTRPYWFTNLNPDVPPPPDRLEPLPADATKDGSTWSLNLQSATWNASAKTCGTVACHFQQTTARWGDEMGTPASCVSCHPT